MALGPKEIDELKALMGVARKREVGFGTCMGKKPANTVLLMDRKKAPDVLGRQAKKAGETAKTAFGSAALDGREFTLKCLEAPPAGLQKSLKMFLGSVGLKFKVLIADAEGNILEGDEEDAPQPDGQATAQPTADAEAKGKLEWSKHQTEYAVRVDAALNAGGPEAAKIKKLWNFALSKAEDESFENAIAALKQIKPLLEDQTVADPFESELAKIAPLVKALMKESPELKTHISSLVATIRDKSGHTDNRKKALGDLNVALNAPAGSHSATDLLVTWRNAKDATDEGMSHLQNLLSGADHPDLQRIAEFGLNGITEGNQVALIQALMEFNAATETDSDKAGKAVLKQVSAYLSFLNSSKAIDLCENNPFGVTCTIKAPLTVALKQIATVAKERLTA